MGSTFPSMGLIRSSKLKASMKGAVLILAFGTLSFTNGFKLNALQKEVSEHAHHHHDHEEYHEQVEDNSDSSEEARSSSERAVAFNFEDDIQPIIVDSPPPGVNFTECVVNLQTGHCCIDFVGEIRSAVTNPILECITRIEKVCHTSYVTQFSSRREQVCEENFEKKCNIVIAEVASNDTVKSCMRPLQRICDDGEQEIVERIRRDTSSHLKTIADILDETLENPRSMMAGRSIEDFQTSNADSECKVYFETICTNPKQAETNTDIPYDNGCERVPVRLCAEGCRIQEGPMTCKDIVLSLVKEVPREECEIVPQKTCRTVNKLYPELIPKELCASTPKEICQLKFSPNPDVPAIQPLIERYCLRGYIEQNLVEDNSENRGKISDKSILETKENDRKNLNDDLAKVVPIFDEMDKFGQENIEENVAVTSKGPQPRKLEISQLDINQVPKDYQKELAHEQAIKNEETTLITERVNEKKEKHASDKLIVEYEDMDEMTENPIATSDIPLTTDDSILDINHTEDNKIYETTAYPIVIIDEEFEGSGGELYHEDDTDSKIAGSSEELAKFMTEEYEIDTISTDQIPLADGSDEFEVTELIPETTEATVEITYDFPDGEISMEPVEESSEFNNAPTVEEFIDLETTMSPIEEVYEPTVETNHLIQLEDSNGKEFVPLPTINKIEELTNEEIFEYVP